MKNFFRYVGVLALGIGFWACAKSSLHLPMGNGMLEWRQGDFALMGAFLFAYWAGSLATVSFSNGERS